MKKKKNLPTSLYEIVSELVTFIDEADYQRKEKNIKSSKEFLENADKINNNGLIK